MTKRSFIPLALGGAALLAACSQNGVQTTDRAEIEDIVRAFIMENPQVIEEAFAQRAEAERQAEIDVIAEAALANVDALNRDPNDFTVGPDDAKITVVEFLDYRCGNCKNTAEWALGLPEKFDNDVRVVFKEYPILSPQSETAALAAIAAGKQGKYIEMHLGLMKLDNSSGFSDEAIDEVARDAGIDVTQMRADMASNEVQFAVSKSKSLARQIGVTGTPNFLISAEGRTAFDVVPGAAPIAVEAMIKDALSEIS